MRPQECEGRITAGIFQGFLGYLDGGDVTEAGPAQHEGYQGGIDEQGEYNNARCPQHNLQRNMQELLITVDCECNSRIPQKRPSEGLIEKQLQMHAETRHIINVFIKVPRTCAVTLRFLRSEWGACSVTTTCARINETAPRSPPKVVKVISFHDMAAGGSEISKCCLHGVERQCFQQLRQVRLKAWMCMSKS